MKRFLAVIIGIVMLLAMTSCVTKGGESSGENPDTVAIKGRIADITGSTLLIAPEEGELFTVGTEELKITDAAGKKMEADKLKPGMLVEVEYDGTALEIYPAILSGASSLRVTDDGDDRIGLYMDVMRELWQRDDGLNGGAEVLAFDLTGAENLNEGEKAAFLYLAMNEFGVDTRKGTFDELREEGLIDKDELNFETGLLITFSTEDVTDNSFKFKASKWRSGLGAYFFEDCAATLKDGEWSYTIGAEAIS